MKYTYYPGCSLETSSRMYDSSVREVFSALDLELEELENWNCCGATAYFSVKETVSLAVSARNLALAERYGNDIVAPCSSCYTILLKTQRIMDHRSELQTNINEALGTVGLSYNGHLRVRHPLEILLNDVGLDNIRKAVKLPLSGLAIAPYYGCQIARGEALFDHPENPIFMDQLFNAVGADVVYYPNKVRCCGGMLMYTYDDIAIRLVAELIRCARENGASSIVTTCPMCHANLDLHQKKLKEIEPDIKPIPIYFFTQLLGLAFGVNPKKMGFDRHYVHPDATLKQLIKGAEEVAYV